MSGSERSPVHVRITNFQSIEDVSIDIDGFTCITGKSNIGKSAIIRAIFRSAVNKPVTGAVRNGAKFCTVDIGSAGWGYRWEKGERGVNRYVIPGKAEPLDKVGQAQVAEVEAMGFGSVEVGDKRLYPWYANQFDPIFLMDESGPSVTSFLSNVAGLDRIQDSIVYASRCKRASSESAKAREGSAALIRAKEAKLANAGAAEALQGDIEEQMVSISEYEAKISRMVGVSRSMLRAREVLTAIEPASGAKVPKDKLSEPVKVLTSMVRHSQAMNAAAKRIVPIRAVSEASIPDPPKGDVERLRKLVRASSIKPLRQLVDALEEASTVQVPDGQGVSSDALRLIKLRDMLTRLNAAADMVRAAPSSVSVPDPPGKCQGLRDAVRLRDGIREARSQVEQLEDQLRSMEQTLNQAKDELSKIPSCPTCGRVALHPTTHATA